MQLEKLGTKRVMDNKQKGLFVSTADSGMGVAGGGKSGLGVNWMKSGLIRLKKKKTVDGETRLFVGI